MPLDSIYGTLNLLVLRTLAEGEAHGLAVKQAIETATGGALRVEAGALYPALHRLHRDELISAEWGLSPKGRRAKIYRMTPEGHQRLAQELASWGRHVQAVSAVLSDPYGPNPD